MPKIKDLGIEFQILKEVERSLRNFVKNNYQKEKPRGWPFKYRMEERDRWGCVIRHRLWASTNKGMPIASMVIQNNFIVVTRNHAEGYFSYAHQWTFEISSPTCFSDIAQTFGEVISKNRKA